jgi:hypothetical protein
MKSSFQGLVLVLALVCLTVFNISQVDAAISFAGSHYDMLSQLRGPSPPYVVSPWRSEGNTKPLDIDGNNVYGSDGYALFATEFNWPSANVGCCGSTQGINSTTYPNLIELPSYVSDSMFLVTQKVGGWNYELIDDPRLVNGYRDYNWGNTQTPPVSPPNSQSPYVKVGLLSGNDIMNNNPKTGPNGAGRWAFTLGADVPQTIRVSVMSDGYDGTQWTATEVLLARVDGLGAILDIVGSGDLARNRFVDMHLFDIVGGQPGENYAIFAKGPPTGDGSGGIAGVAFDSVIPEPSGLMLLISAVGTLTGLRRGRAK